MNYSASCRAFCRFSLQMSPQMLNPANQNVLRGKSELSINEGSLILTTSSGSSYISRSRGGARGPCPIPLKISHKKMATKGGRIDFMFLAYLVAGSDTELVLIREGG